MDTTSFKAKSYSDGWPFASVGTCTLVSFISNLSLIVSVFLSHINNVRLMSSWHRAVLLSSEVLCKLTAERKGLAASIDFHLGVALSAHHLQASQSLRTCVCMWTCVLVCDTASQSYYIQTTSYTNTILSCIRTHVCHRKLISCSAPHSVIWCCCNVV